MQTKLTSRRDDRLILFDTNVILDVLLAREPFVEMSAKVFDACDRGTMTGFLCASAVTDLFYIIRKATGGPAMARGLVGDLCGALEIAPVNRTVIAEALASALPDFEDAVAAAAARMVNADALVTRDPSGFSGAGIPVHEPGEIVLMAGL